MDKLTTSCETDPHWKNPCGEPGYPLHTAVTIEPPQSTSSLKDIRGIHLTIQNTRPMKRKARTHARLSRSLIHRRVRVAPIRLHPLFSLVLLLLLLNLMETNSSLRSKFPSLTRSIRKPNRQFKCSMLKSQNCQNPIFVANTAAYTRPLPVRTVNRLKDLCMSMTYMLPSG